MARADLVPPPARSPSELLDVARTHLTRLRRRQRVQAGVVIGLTTAIAAVAIPTLLWSTTIDNAQEIAPIEQPERRRVDEPIPRSKSEVERSEEVRNAIDLPSSSSTRRGPAPAGAPGDIPRPAPGEERLVFASFRDHRDRSSIYSMATDGSGVARVTAGGLSDTAPAWSPDGSSIAFTSGAYRPADGAHDIFIASSDGSDVDQLTDTPEHEADVFWSPDGDRLVFSRLDQGIGRYSDLFILDIATGRTSRLTDTSQIDEWGATWSPDGDEIAFQRIDWHEDNYEQGIYAIRSDGSRTRRLTAGRDFEPSWSPSGGRIAFARYTNIGGVNTTPADASSIFVMDADGSDVVRVTTESAVVDRAPDWSPGSDEIVFTRDPDGSDSMHVTFEWATGRRTGPLSQICVTPVDGSQVRELTEPTNGDAFADWSG